MSNLEEFCRFDKIYEEVFEKNRDNAASYFADLDSTSISEMNFKEHSNRKNAILQIFPREKFLNDQGNYRGRKIITIPKINLNPLDKVLELQENMKILESDTKTLSELISFLGKFGAIRYELNKNYRSQRADLAIKIQDTGEEFIALLEKKSRTNKILKRWFQDIEPTFSSSLDKWKEETDFLNKIYSTGFALYTDNDKGISIKPIGISAEVDRNQILAKIKSQINNGVNEGKLEIGKLSIPFNLSIGEYFISNENTASIIKGNFPYYSGMDSAINNLIAPFFELDHYLRFIYLTRDKDSPFCYPKINLDNETLFDAKNINPYFLKVLENQKILTTNNLRITRDRNIVFISGSNNGGKTTLLRTIAFIYNLAYHGAKVPAISCELSPIDGIDIYEPENGNTSGTFKSNLIDLKDGLEKAEKHKNYLYLIDEPVIGGTNLTAMKDAFDRFLGRVSKLKGTTIVATNHSEYLREQNSPQFSYYAMSKEHKISKGIGDSEGESIIKEVGF